MKPQAVDIDGVKVLCVAEARGALSQIQQHAKAVRAQAVVHVGSFGFFDGESALNLAADRLAHVANSSRVVNGTDFHHMSEQNLRESVGSQLSELSVFLAGVKKFQVPVYVVYGGLEDVKVVQKFRNGTYKVPNLHLVDEHNAPLIEGTKLRLLGFPGQFDLYKLLDVGEASDDSHVAGNGVNMWATLWQLGELFHTARKTFDPTEIRVFLTATPPCDVFLLQYIAILLRTDFYLSGDQPNTHAANLHHAGRHNNSRGPTFYQVDQQSAYLQSYNTQGTGIEFPVYNKRLQSGKDALFKLWSRSLPFVKKQSQPNQFKLLESTVSLLTSFPSSTVTTHIERAYRSLWYFRLGPVDSNQMVLQYASNHKVSLHALSAGYDFSLRQTATTATTTGAHAAGADAESNLDAEEDDEETGSVASAASAADSDDLRAKKKKLRKEQESEEKKEKQKLARERIEREKLDYTPFGLWFRNGDRPAEEILGCLSEDDRSLNPKVVIKTTTKPQGGKTKVALVFFQTAEQASQAYDRVDKDEAGTVSIYQPEIHKPKPFRRKRFN